MSAKTGLFAIGVILLSACGTERGPAELYLAGDYAAAFKSYSRLADSGDAAATNFVGIHYYLGAGVERDLGEAFKWFERAALARDAHAQRNLGVMYLRGWGVPKDNALAYGWLYQALAAGNEGAREYLRMASDYVTPNQSMMGRDAVAARLTKHDAESR